MADSSQKMVNVQLTVPRVPTLAKEEEVSLEEDNNSHIVETSLSVINDVGNVKIVPVNATKSKPSFSIFKLGPQVLASISVSLGAMVVGFASAYTSPALASMASSNSTISPTKQEGSWIGSLMPLCALIGGVAGGPLIELIGRKTTILATAIPFIISWLLIALAVNIPMIYVGRSIAGFCVGIASLCLPVYLGETLQPEVRGMLGLVPTTVGNIGMLLCYVAGKYMDWSALAFLGGFLPVPFLILMCLIPETPRWYISKNKKERARKALQWLRGLDADISTELEDIENSFADEQKISTGSKFDLFEIGNLQLVGISMGLMFFQQMSGINAVVFYTVEIFEAAGSTIEKFLSTIIVGIVNFAATFVASLLIDRLGRKVLLYISGGAMTISLTTLATYFYLKNYSYNTSEYGWLPLASFVVYVIGFSFGYGPIPWLMMGEILPAKIRGPAASVVTGFNWTCTFIVTKTFKDLILAVGEHWTFWIFALICLAGLFFVFFFVPETQGKSLEEIEKKFKGPARRMSSIANLKPLPMAV